MHLQLRIVNSIFGSACGACVHVQTSRTLAGMAEALTNAEKSDLRARAQRLEPVVKVGQSGITEGFLKSLDEALTQHELVKIKFAAKKDEKKTLAPEIAERTGSALIARVGNVAVYFRRRGSAPTAG